MKQSPLRFLGHSGEGLTGAVTEGAGSEGGDSRKNCFRKKLTTTRGDELKRRTGGGQGDR